MKSRLKLEDFWVGARPVLPYPSQVSNYYVYVGIFSILLALFFWWKLPRGTLIGYFAPSKIYDQSCLRLGIAAFCLNIGMTTLLGKLFPQFNPPQSDDLRNMMGDLTGKILVVLLTMVIAPVVEEILFRGFILDGSKQIWKKSTFAAIAIAGVFFAFCHGITQIPGVFLFAFCLGLLRERTGSLRVNMAVHMFNNLFGIAVLYSKFEVSYLIAAGLLVVGARELKRKTIGPLFPR